MNTFMYIVIFLIGVLTSLLICWLIYAVIKLCNSKSYKLHVETLFLKEELKNNKEELKEKNLNIENLNIDLNLNTEEHDEKCGCKDCEKYYQ